MKEGHLRVKVGKVEPNTWNPNEMSPQRFNKLKHNLSVLLESGDPLPPIIVRPYAEHKKYQIIDGEHRWRACKELGEEKIAVFSMRVNEATARVLTNNLNYLRGTANREKYATGLVKLIELGKSPYELSELLPEDAEEIDQLLGEVDVSVEAYTVLSQQDEEEGEEGGLDGSLYGDEDIWTTASFRVTTAQAKVIEQELQRIMGALTGKNKRGRALEYMAVQSSQSSLPGAV